MSIAGVGWGMKHLDPNSQSDNREVKKCLVRISLNKTETIKPYNTTFGVKIFTHSLN